VAFVESAHLVKVDTIGIRPAGAQPDSAFIVRTAVDAGKALGFTAPNLGVQH
jgi:hypothetical protein